MPLQTIAFTGKSFAAFEAAQKATEQANAWLQEYAEVIGDVQIQATSAACANGTMKSFVHAITIIYRLV